MPFSGQDSMYDNAVCVYCVCMCVCVCVCVCGLCGLCFGEGCMIEISKKLCGLPYHGKSFEVSVFLNANTCTYVHVKKCVCKKFYFYIKHAYMCVCIFLYLTIPDINCIS